MFATCLIKTCINITFYYNTHKTQAGVFMLDKKISYDGNCIMNCVGVQVMCAKIFYAKITGNKYIHMIKQYYTIRCSVF